MKRYYILFLLLISSVLIAACGDTGQAKNDKDSVSASSVSGTENSGENTLGEMISNSYFDEVTNIVSTLDSYSVEVVRDVLSSNDYDKDNAISKSNEFSVYISSVNLTPVTEKEKLADKYVKDFLYNCEQLSYYVLQYLHKDEEVYKGFIKDYVGNLQQDLKLIQTVYNK